MTKTCRPVLFIVTVLLFLRNESKSKLTFAAEFAVYLELGAAEIERTALLVEFGGNLANIAWLHYILEADFIQSGVQCKMSGDIILDENCTALSHDFALDNTRYNRVSREMSSCEELIFLDGIFAMSDTIYDFSLFYQKHRLPMWQELLDIFFSQHNVQVLVQGLLVFVFSECYASIMSTESE